MSTVNCSAEYEPQRDSLYIVIPLTVVYVIILITGTIGNISTCIVIAKNKVMHTATNYYLFSLAISDLVLLITGLPQEIYLFWYRYPYIFGSAFCFLRGLFAEVSSNATVLTITAFTVERYLAICHPFLSHTLSKLSRAIKLIILIWFFSVCLAIPQAMPLKVTATDCPRCLPVGNVDNVFTASTIVFFVAPMTLIVVLYILIGLKLKSSRMMKKRISVNARAQSSSSRKIIKMLVAVVVAFFICWAPFHIQRLYSIYQHDYSDTHLKIYEIFTYISGVLYFLATTINPILYNIMSAKFREAFKETFSRCCGINHLHHGRPQRSYSVLSRSNMRGPDSTDSGSHEHTVQTNITNSSTHKNNSSCDSFNCNAHGKRYKGRGTTYEHEECEPENQCIPSVEMQNLSPLDSPGYVSVHMTTVNPTKLGKFLQLFHCLAKRTLDDGKRFSSYYTAPLREPNFPELEKTENIAENSQRCDSYHQTCISNSSLKEVENGAIEDELTTYMREIQLRECCS